MDEDEPDRRAGRSKADATVAGTKTWVVSNDGTGCSHAAERLRPLGDDGRNAYYRCDGCGAVLVAQNELVRAARATREPPA